MKTIYKGNDLGLTLCGDKAAFRTWAPLASDVKLLLFKTSKSLNAPDTKPIQMTFSKKDGTWSVKDVDIKEYSYYKFRITNSGISHEIADINSFCCSPDSVASQIVDINKSSDAIPEQNKTDKAYGTQKDYFNPFGNNGKEKKSYTDAVIYEMHVRDWSRATVTDSLGRYLDIADSTRIINHLKELGVTHVQLLPVFDYAETNEDKSYNWGYNPYHYNVPEGRYASTGYTEGTTPVKELRRLIGALHENGIAVNMDVVYNHTNSTGEQSLYDMTVPYYFYRTREDKTYYNGSGCGNEINTGAFMVKKYIIESLRHWMLDYHFNGFRFDLMGVFERSTMKDIYKELYKIDPNVMVYGEPWTGGECAVVKGLTSETKRFISECSPSRKVNGTACFDDGFRDAIKGAEFGGFKKGQVQGIFNDKGICKGLTGSVKDAGKIGRFINYAECHDNFTLFDKLALSILDRTSGIADLYEELTEEQLEKVKKEDMLAASYVLLAQGTPFINGGQEFMRTKMGDENSYVSPDSINAINLDFKTRNAEVFNTYKALIAFRKANSKDFGKNRKARAYPSKPGLTVYSTQNFIVYFNATDEDQDIFIDGCRIVIDKSNGSWSKEPRKYEKSILGAKDFVIISRS